MAAQPLYRATRTLCFGKIEHRIINNVERNKRHETKRHETLHYPIRGTGIPCIQIRELTPRS